VRVVAVAGSRGLGAEWAGVVGAVVRSVGRSGSAVGVGCCVGADALALGAALASAVPCRVFAAFGPGGVGSWRGSSVAGVAAAGAAGAPVVWWAGGSGPLVRRLGARSRAVVSVSCGLVAFVSGGFAASPGSWGSVRFAVSRGLPVVVFPCGSFSLPLLGSGSWVVSGAGVWARGFRWVPEASPFADNACDLLLGKDVFAYVGDAWNDVYGYTIPKGATVELVKASKRGLTIRFKGLIYKTTWRCVRKMRTSRVGETIPFILPA